LSLFQKIYLTLRIISGRTRYLYISEPFLEILLPTNKLFFKNIKLSSSLSVIKMRIVRGKYSKARPIPIPEGIFLPLTRKTTTPSTVPAAESDSAPDHFKDRYYSIDRLNLGKNTFGCDTITMKQLT